MGVTPNVRRDAAPGLRAVSLARRMLAGGASCSVTAWRLDLCHDMVAHGLTTDGEIVVALWPAMENELFWIPDGTVLDVRIDMVRHSCDTMLNVVASSCHMLGRMALLGRERRAELIEGHRLPERVAELAQLEGTRVGLVSVDRVLVHDHNGPVSVPWQELGGELPDFPADDLAVHDVVASLGQGVLKRWCTGVRLGLLPGTATVRPSGPQVCAHLLDKVSCVDVDRTGVTLMHIGAEETATVFVEFDSRPTDLPSLQRAVADISSAL
ncbi:MAG: hypothetical protein Q4D96_04460 [Propionibacteriaceae bacterium]|nr:hypothetical protein [Propionibacteriaceae bacterium]